ncbi:MAG: ASKHA domain-containing protein [Candidatus Promineifilaceae bacterium]
MAQHIVKFDAAEESVTVVTGTLLTEAALEAGVEISQPCGGQGRCGRCMVRVSGGSVRRRSTLRLTEDDVKRGYALACQSVVESDVEVLVPPQEKVERRLSTDRVVAKVAVPAGYSYERHQSIRRLNLTLNPPTMDDQSDDWSRLKGEIRRALAHNGDGELSLQASLPLLRKVGQVLREGKWKATAILDTPTWGDQAQVRLIDLQPGHTPEESPLYGAAIDIGTTTVTVWLVDLVSGEVSAQAAEYNGQIARGEDVISRIIYATKSKRGAEEMHGLVLETINNLIQKASKKTKIEPESIIKTVIAGNSTMIHLLLGLPAESIRLMPFVTSVNSMPALAAREVGQDGNGLSIHPEATVDCLPGVASYVGADITSGVLSSGMDDTDKVNLFLDIGTNGETVLGSHEWLVTCACSAGPAFEGAGVLNGMRATRGAIEEVWINGTTFEPSYRVIGDAKPRGFCGSGLIALLAEMFLNGVVDKGGNFNETLNTKRIRMGDHGLEYVVVWAKEAHRGRDIAITRVDIDNLVRAKAAIYAGFTVLAESVGFPLEGAEQVLIGGAFGKYINVEKAVEIGLLPDMPWEQFQFLGNTSVMGAYFALLSQDDRARIRDIAERMTYIELSADNSFYNAFTSALFLPHTDLSKFPSVVAELEQIREQRATADRGGGT